jgi:hypothetical protein
LFSKFYLGERITEKELIDWIAIVSVRINRWPVSSHAPAELGENSYARKTSGDNRVSCERRYRDSLLRTVAL